MTKSELISSIVNKTGLSRADIRLTVEMLLQTLQTTLTMGEKVHLRGFGSFLTKKRARKLARNIKKNTALMVEEHYVPSFKPAKALVAKIKENLQDLS